MSTVVQFCAGGESWDDYKDLLEAEFRDLGLDVSLVLEADPTAVGYVVPSAPMPRIPTV